MSSPYGELMTGRSLHILADFLCQATVVLLEKILHALAQIMNRINSNGNVILHFQARDCALKIRSSNFP